MALTSGVLEYFDESGNVMAQRLPEAGSGEFKMGTYVVVRESQEAVFFRDGQMLDTLGPGRHQITTANLPLITKLFSLVTTGGESPFKAELYFVSKQPFLNEGWGTDQPILFRDKEFGMVRLRAFGICSHRIIDNNLFINKVVGTRGRYARDDAKDFIRNIIVGRLNDALGEVMETILDLPKYYDEVGVAMKSKVRDDLEKYGIEIVDFIIKAITPPEEVQKAIDERTSMGAIGNMQQYMMFKAAKSMQDAANNQGGGAGMGMGMGWYRHGYDDARNDGRCFHARHAATDAARYATTDATRHAAARAVGPARSASRRWNILYQLWNAESGRRQILWQLRKQDGRLTPETHVVRISPCSPADGQGAFFFQTLYSVV